MVRLLVPVLIPPAMVRRLPELFHQAWAALSVKGALIVRVNATALSINMATLPFPLIVPPPSVSVLPEMVTFRPTLPTIQRPPTVAVEVKLGWLLLLNVLSKTALSVVPPGGLPSNQLVPVPQVVLVVPVQCLSIPKTSCGVKSQKV